MSDSDWYKRNAHWLVIGTIATCLCAAIAYYAYSWGVSKQVEYEWAASENTRKYSNYTYQPERSTCFRKPFYDQPYCIAQATDKERDYQRNEEDLVAQKTTAIWTFLMGCAAIVGVALSTLGIFLVFTTFRAASRANIIAREIGEAQVRAYLTIQNVTIAYNRKGGDPKAIFEFYLANTGNSPASEIYISADIEVMHRDGNGIEVIQHKKEIFKTAKFANVAGGSNIQHRIPIKEIPISDIKISTVGSEATSLVTMEFRYRHIFLKDRDADIAETFRVQIKTMASGKYPTPLV